MKAINKKATQIKPFGAFAVFLVLIAFFASCKSTALPNTDTIDSTKEAIKEKESIQFDINETLFIGDSNIYHLKSYGILPENQILTGKECYMTLDLSVCDKYVVYPGTSNEMKISEAISKLKPKFIVITIGTDGAYTLDKSGFYLSYTQLLDTVIEASPDSVIGVQSIFPVCEGQKDVRFKDVDKANEKFRLANQWLKEIACEYKIVYFNTSSVLSDENGRLRKDFNTDHLDGYHLNKIGLYEMLNYIEKALK